MFGHHIRKMCLRRRLTKICILRRISLVTSHVSHPYKSTDFTQALKIGLEVSADKTKYMVMSRNQNAGRNHSMRIDNSTFERVEEFKYLGTTLTNQNSILEEIKSRLRSGSAC